MRFFKNKSKKFKNKKKEIALISLFAIIIITLLIGVLIIKVVFALSAGQKSDIIAYAPEPKLFKINPTWTINVNLAASGCNDGFFFRTMSPRKYLLPLGSLEELSAFDAAGVTFSDLAFSYGINHNNC